MYAERHQVTLTTDGSGVATGYTPRVTGRVVAVVLGTNDLDATADTTITAEATGQAILTLTNVNTAAAYYPRPGVHDAVGAAKTYDGTRAIGEAVSVALDRVKIAIAQGGNTKTAVFHVIIE